jgi:hypothetical protein
MHESAISTQSKVSDIGTNLTPRSRKDVLGSFIFEQHKLPRVTPLHITPKPKSPLRLPRIDAFSALPGRGDASSFETPPEVGVALAGSASPFGPVRNASARTASSIRPSRNPVSLDELAENMSRIQLPPLNESYGTCMNGCKKTCRAKHPRAGGGTNRRRKNRKQKGTRRNGSRRYRR